MHSPRNRTRRAPGWRLACASTPARGPSCPEESGPDHDFGSPAILVRTAAGRELLLAGQKSGVVWAFDPDKNGEVWAGALHAGRFVRFNPRTERWIEYMMPEPYSHNRRTWIDNSTSPVTVWYVDHNGYMVRIQPLE